MIKFDRRGATYNRLIDKIARAEGIADQWLLTLAAGWMGQKR